jgi:mono/diheme cytochrome c family protein
MLLLAAGSLFAALIGCEQKTPAADPVKRGEYLVTIGGCHDCHTPKQINAAGMPEPMMTSMLSGHPAEAPYPLWKPEDLQMNNAIASTNTMLTAWAGPWGVSFGINLTPDNETGIGEWTEQAFMQAMRTGKHQGQPNARDILPPMPWQSIAQMTDEDLKAVWAYLRSVPAVKNQAPLPVPPSMPPPQGD